MIYEITIIPTQLSLGQTFQAKKNKYDDKHAAYRKNNAHGVFPSYRWINRGPRDQGCSKIDDHV